MGSVDTKHYVVMVAHDSVGADVDSKHRRQKLNSVNHLRFSVFVAFTGGMVTSAKKCSPYTAVNAVVVRRIGQADDFVSWLWHAPDTSQGRFDEAILLWSYMMGVYQQS